MKIPSCNINILLLTIILSAPVYAEQEITDPEFLQKLIESNNSLFRELGISKPAEEKQYLPCNNGPTALRQVDDGEQKGLVASFSNATGHPITPEVAAEILIADCSQQLSQLSAIAALDSSTAAQSIVNVWQTNLDFMKWWLENRRSKTQNK